MGVEFSHIYQGKVELWVAILTGTAERNITDILQLFSLTGDCLQNAETSKFVKIFECLIVCFFTSYLVVEHSSAL